MEEKWITETALNLSRLQSVSQWDCQSSLSIFGPEVSWLPPVWSSQTFWMKTEPVGWPQAAALRPGSDQQINCHRGTKEISKKVFPETFQFIFVIKRMNFIIFINVPYFRVPIEKRIFFIILIFNLHLSLLYWLRCSTLWPPAWLGQHHLWTNFSWFCFVCELNELRCFCIRLDHSHWSRSVEILCSDWWSLLMLVLRSMP